MALATAKRVGELQVLSIQVTFQDNDVVLSYLLDFVSKTETLTNPLPWEFVLPSLSDAVVSHDSELLLCPVWALWWYLYRT